MKEKEKEKENEKEKVKETILVEHYFKTSVNGEMVEYWLYADREPYLRSLPEWARMPWVEILEKQEKLLTEGEV